MEQIDGVLSDLGISTTRAADQLKQYTQLLRLWNQKTNLISRKTEDHIFAKHILPSIAYAYFIESFNSVIDIGSGAGLPGLVLKIILPDLKIDLLDSNRKKILFCKYVINELDLKNINAILSRAEDHPNRYDVALFRSVADIPTLKRLASFVLNPEGYLLSLKGEMEVSGDLFAFSIPKTITAICPDLKASRVIKIHI